MAGLAMVVIFCGVAVADDQVKPETAHRVVAGEVSHITLLKGSDDELYQVVVIDGSGEYVLAPGTDKAVARGFNVRMEVLEQGPEDTYIQQRYPEANQVKSMEITSLPGVPYDVSR